jgi:hypothetical protein
MLNHSVGDLSGVEVREMIRSADIEIVDPRFKHLEIGGVKIRPTAVQYD